jgi:hypothetical protein
VIEAIRGQKEGNVLFSWEKPALGLKAEVEWTRPLEANSQSGVMPSSRYVSDEGISGWRTRLSPGTYEWRVRARVAGDEEKVSAWSDPMRFDVRANTGAAVPPPVPAPEPAPVPAPTVEAKAPEAKALPKPRAVKVVTQPEGAFEQPLDQTEIRLEWAEFAGAERYEVVITDGENGGGTLLKREVTDPRLTWSLDSLKSTRFRYRVTAITGGGERVSSPEAVIELEMGPPLPKQPASGARVAPNKSGAIILTWQSTVLTEQYMVQVATDPGFKEIVREEEVPTNLLVARALAKGGKYYWRVKAVAYGHSSAWSESSRFTVGGE